jgi:uncharacterized protein YjbI with pentapeptide repeats
VPQGSRADRLPQGKGVYGDFSNDDLSNDDFSNGYLSNDDLSNDYLSNDDGVDVPGSQHGNDSKQ